MNPGAFKRDDEYTTNQNLLSSDYSPLLRPRKSLDIFDSSRLETPLLVSELQPDTSITSHEVAIDTPSAERTNAFFTSQSTSYKLPTPPHRSNTLPNVETTAAGNSSKSHTALSRSVSDSRSPHSSRSGSEGNDFFLSKSDAGAPRTLSPSPPPKITAAKTNTSVPAGSGPRMALARLFPSRYRPSRDALEDYEAPISSGPPESYSSPKLSAPTPPPISPDPAFFVALPPPSARPSPSPQSGLMPLHRETRPPSPPHSHLHDPQPGKLLEMDDIRLRYIRLVGKGAFSSVWLARDEANSFSPYHQPHERRPSEVARRKRDRALDGLKPTNPRANLSFSGVNSKPAASWLSADPLSPRGLSMAEEGIEDDDLDVNMLEDGSTTPQDFIASAASRCGRLVAVKMMDIAACDANDRTRISFVREVEVLRHISHPNIVSYLHSFTTPAHHCLVLEYIGGGELFDMVNTTDIYAKFTEPFIRRIWGELALAVGWMHNVCLVHRDIKLENIMLTINPSSLSTHIDLSALPVPLIKLTDFGLARFIDSDNPLLTTRCGSEYYAAPEIIMAKPYDGRETDAWACGVVLFALATRVLPFDADVSRFYLSSTSDEKRGRDPSPGAHSMPEKKDTKRSYMLRIANGEYHWPGDASRSHRHYPVPSMPGSPYRPHAGSSTVSSRRSSLASSDDWYRSGIQHAVFFSEGVPVPSTSGASQRHAPSVATSTPPSSVVGESSAEHDPLSAALKSHQLLSPSHAHFPASASDASHSHRPRSSVEHHPPPDLVTAGLKRIVGRLLVRDPRKRARVMDLWTDEWMRGEGAPLPPPEALLGDEDDPLDPFSLSHPYSEPHPDFGYRTGVGPGDVDTQYLRARCLSDASMNAESGHVSPIGAGPSRPLSATYGGGLIYEMPPSSVHRRSASGRLVVGRGGIPPVAKQDVTSPP